MLFISPQKLFAFSRYLSFCLDVLVTYQNGLIKKIRLISNFVTSQPGKGNQTMKFGQLIQCKIKNIFLEKSCAICSGETSPRHFLKNQNRAYLWINSLKFYIVCFYCMVSRGLSQYTETKLQTTCFHLILNFF